MSAVVTPWENLSGGWRVYWENLPEEEKEEIATRAMAGNAYIRHRSGDVSHFPNWDAALDACVDGQEDVVVLGWLDFDDAQRAELLASRKPKEER